MCSDRRRSNWNRSENRILFNRQRTEELTSRRGKLDLEIEQAAAQAAQVEVRATAHSEAVRAAPGDVARIEAILAALAAASAEISGAHESHGSAQSPRSGAPPRSSETS